jgi:polysaccharide export outer membrane protein
LAVKRSTYIAAALMLLMVGCTPGADLPPVPDYTMQGYRLGSGDQLRIITFGEDQLTGEFRVDDQGAIALPLIGTVPAAGQTTQELNNRIAQMLRKNDLMRDPRLSIEVIAYRPVFVLGEVARPGQYPFQPGMTMLTVVAVAGGFTYRGVEDYAGVVRLTDKKPIEGKIYPSSFIAPNDVIQVFQRRF